MATFYQGSPVIDPDSLGYTIAAADIATNFAACATPLLIDTTNRRVALKVTGTLGTDGAAIKAAYSKFKEIWRTDAELIKFPFPMGPITDEQFELINGWNWDKTQTSGDASATTVELLRTGGWSVVNNSGNITEMWTGIISLGTLVDNTDQIYSQQVNESTAAVNFVLTGPVNQALQVLRDDNGNGNFAEGDDFDRRSYLKMFVREFDKLYSQSAIQDIGVSQVTFQAYRFPLSNADDLNINASDVLVAGVATASGSSAGTTATIITAVPHELTTGDLVNIAGVAPAGYNDTAVAVTVTNSTTFTYTAGTSDMAVIGTQGTVQRSVNDNINITYLRDANDDLYNIIGQVTNTTYAIGDVVQEDNGATSRWFACTGPGTVTGSAGVAQASWGGTATWAAYVGERQVGANYYAYTTIIDADTTIANPDSGPARTTDIYTTIQYYLRQNSDIDASAGTVTGETADSLLRFVGSTLITSTGVYIDNFNVSDTNAIEFFDYSGTARLFPFVAALTINFGTNLQNDASARYWVFFTNDDIGDNTGRDFGTTDAILVNDNDAAAMNADVSAAPSVSRSYNYDGNIQRGNASAGEDAPITVVGIGLSTGQYVTATGTIQRSIQNSVSLVAALERNYSNPA